MGPNKL